MSATASPAQTAPRPPQSATSDIEASCRVPLLALFAGGALWLFIGTLFELITTLKFHDPQFLATHAHFTYGRIHAAHQTALLYGFGIQAGLGVGLWLLCRLGRASLVGPGVVFIGAILWNTAVAVGLCGILCGDLTGFESFEMPGYVSMMLFVGYSLMAVCGLLTFHNRTEQRAYPSQWFVLGAIFWFPWIFSTATALLIHHPVRGVLQSSIAWWYAHNLSTIVLGFAGLAPIFYFIPKLLGRPLHSYYLAAFAFWTLALFGSWGGIPGGAPLPAWIISMSVVGTILTTVSLLAVAVNFYETAKQKLDALDADVTLRFSYVALIFWLIAGAQQIVGVLPNVSRFTDYTWFSVAHWELFHYGFFVLAIFGAIYYIVPRLLPEGDIQSPWSHGLVKGHFGFTFCGVLVAYIALLVAGIGQGFLLNDVKYSFAQVMLGTLSPVRLIILGDLCIIIGTVCFLLNFALVLSRACCQCWHEMQKEGA
jgi:cytochrome c oxidase cbb3-type subunit 1